MYDQVTVVVGIDAKTIEQLAVSHKTWKLHRPEMWQMPWVLFFDDSAELQIMDLLALMAVPKLTLVPWGRDAQYESQRERMLSGFVHVAAMAVQTEFWLKLDTDAVCLPSKHKMFEDEWFEKQPCGRRFAFVASPWHYSKPAEQPGQLDAWGDTLGPVWKGERLNLEYNPGAKRIGHPRMASWISLYSYQFTHLCASLAEPFKMPVPSQDGYMFYVAHRAPWPYKLVRFKRRGFANVSKLHNLKERVAQICAG